MKRSLRIFRRFLPMVALAMLVAPLLSGCGTTALIANDEFEECRQCDPPNANDVDAAVYAICQAKAVDICRAKLGHDPEYNWGSEFPAR